MAKKRKAANLGKARPTKMRRCEVSDQEDDKIEPSGTNVAMAVAEESRALQEEIEAAAIQAKKDAVEKHSNKEANENEAEENAEEEVPSDPYLLADAAYIQKDTRWKNKQRTLVFCSRGVGSQSRHLCDDIRKLLPHHKTEPKFEKRSNFHDINEICELKNCNNVIFFEARKRTDLYMYVGRIPQGPTLKFQVLNIHTTGEVRLAGNCLAGSRPLLYFDKNFSDLSYLKLVKTMFTQTFGTPRNHPKSKPFHDHVMAFYWLDKKIWFRHYQITPETQDNMDDPEKQQLTEIGPRFVLDPIRILNGSFSGQTIFSNAHYMSPTALRVQAKKLLANPYKNKLINKAEREERIETNRLEEDPTDAIFE